MPRGKKGKEEKKEGRWGEGRKRKGMNEEKREDGGKEGRKGGREGIRKTCLFNRAGCFAFVLSVSPTHSHPTAISSSHSSLEVQEKNFFKLNKVARNLNVSLI